MLPHDYQIGARADRDGMNETWVGGYYLGIGGEGVVNLWAKVDQHGKVVRTMAIKDERSRHDTTEPEGYEGFWEDLVSKKMDWGVSQINEVGQATVKERFCREAYIQAMLSRAKGEPRTDCVPLLGYKSRHLPKSDGEFHNYTHWRLFMRYYAYGDLGDLIRRHMDARKPIPEPFIWWTFYCLIQACQQMETRVRARSNGKFRSKEEVIVAFDMKPNNVLLARPGGDEFPAYPRPMVADFGGAMLTYVTDPVNDSGDLMGAVTPGWRPPEVSIKKRNSGGYMTGCKSPKLNWTNIWQVGRIIESMMRSRTHIGEPNYWSSKVEDRESKILVEDTPYIRYSDGLRQLVFSCQRYLPYKRPSIDDVIKTIAANRPQWGEMERWGKPEWLAEHRNDKKRKREDEGDEEDLKAAKKIKAGEAGEAGGKGEEAEKEVHEGGRTPDMSFASFFRPEERAGVWELYDNGVYIPKNCDIVYRGDETFWQPGHTVYDEDKNLKRSLGYRIRKGKAELTSEQYAKDFGTIEARKRRIERGSPKGSDIEAVAEHEEEERAALEKMEDEERAELERARAERAEVLMAEHIEKARKAAEEDEKYEKTEEDESDYEDDDDVDGGAGDGGAGDGGAGGEDVVMGEDEGEDLDEDDGDGDYDDDRDGILYFTDGDVIM